MCPAPAGSVPIPEHYRLEREASTHWPPISTVIYSDGAGVRTAVGVACGQATMCWNLLEYLFRRHGGEPAGYPEQARALWERLVADWDAMNAEPYALLREALGGRELTKPPSRGDEPVRIATGTTV